MDALMQDLRYAVRSLSRSRLFAVAAVAAIALGIGANTAIFALVDGLLLRPLPFDQADRLVVVWDENPQAGARWNEVAPGNYLALAERARSFERIAAYDIAFFRHEQSDGTQQGLRGMVVEPAFFDVLRTRPAHGRAFVAGEDAIGAAPVAIVSHGFAQRMGGVEGMVGSTLRLNGGDVEVIGVMPPAFHFASPADVWMPLVLNEQTRTSHARHILRVVARLAPGATIQQAAAEASAIARDLERAQPQTNEGWQLSVYAAQEGIFQGPTALMLRLLWGAVGLVLLIVCADVANLLLARMTGRGRELAVRGALGAGRGRVLQQLLTENAVLTVAGGVAGVVLGVWLLDMIIALLPTFVRGMDPRFNEMRVDPRVAAYGLIAALGTGVLFGILPALRAAGGDPGVRLRDSERGTSAGPRAHRLRFVLIAAQFALALGLLSAATTLTAAFVAQFRANPQMDRALLTAWLQIPPDIDDATRVHDALLRAFEAEPALEDAALTFSFPLSGEGFRPAFDIEGQPVAGGAARPWTHVRPASPGYLDVLGVPVVQGRALDTSDRAEAAPVAVVSRDFARRFLGDGDVIGRRITIDDDVTRTIVGVVGDVTDWRTGTDSDAYVYVPIAQYPVRSFAVVARPAADRVAATAAVRSAAASVDARLRPSTPVSIGEVLDESVAVQRFSTTLLGAFAVLALTLAAIGVFGVMAYIVGLRTREIGVRMALGASGGEVRRMVLLQGMRPVAAGITVGLVLAIAARRVVSAAVFGGASAQAAPFIAAAVLAAVALLALWAPAARATRADPVATLRQE
jgi:putative ABC transport system permease protein